MWIPWCTMNQFSASLAASILLLVLCGGTACCDEADDRAEALVTSLVGRLQRDDNVEGRPVVWIDVSATKVTDDDLGVFAKLTDIDALTLDNTQVTDAGIAKLRNLLTL